VANLNGVLRAGRVVDRLRALGNPANIAGMARYGIATQRAFGVGTPQLQAIARELGRDHALSLSLWATGFREARILAAYVAVPELLTIAQMNAWAADFDSWDICDNCCLHLFRRSPLAWGRTIAWSRRRQEFVRRAGFTMVATLAVHDKQAGDQQFLALLPIIEQGAVDERNFVKKAVNWALRQVGKRNQRLHREAMAVAHRLIASASASARWVGRDALKELESEKVMRCV
jgi:3-methyladenine DNA glycosylase AlkD